MKHTKETEYKYEMSQDSNFHNEKNHSQLDSQHSFSQTQKIYNSNTTQTPISQIEEIDNLKNRFMTLNDELSLCLESI